MAYYVISLADMIDENQGIGEDRTKEILSNFSCPNRDVEDYIKYKAIPMAPQQIAPTHLVFTVYKDEKVLVGYFAIATKTLSVKKSSISASIARRLKKFAEYNEDNRSYNLSAQLIAQLGKNFTNKYNELITGDELLKLAFDKIQEAQKMVGGKVVYLECEDKPELVDFYKSNGFTPFGKRDLPKHDQELVDGAYLVQMIRYLD